MGIVGLISFVGVVAFGALFAFAILKGGSLKLPTIGMIACFVLLVAVVALMQLGIGPFGNATVDRDANPTGEIQESAFPEEDNQNTDESDPGTSKEPQGEESEEPERSQEDSGTLESGTYTLPCGMKIQFFDFVRNDVTGKWRRATTADSFVPADYALEYYNEMFSSDDEIHSIWNATLKTNTRITASSGLLFVDTLEYVEGEEHDAKLMFSGMLLDSKIINIETGEPVETDP